MRVYSVYLLALIMSAASVTADVLYESHFESDTDLAGWQILQTSDHAIVPAVTPTHIRQPTMSQGATGQIIPSVSGAG
jgi:hypothetical protein